MEVHETSDGMRWYVVEGRYLPSVTTVLGKIFNHPDWARYDLSSPAVIYARNKGRAVHKACYWLAKGRRLKPESIDPALEPYIAQFENFLIETKFETEEAEFLAVSRRNGFAGRGDLWGKMPGDGLDLIRNKFGAKTGHLIDIKTGVIQVNMAGWQTAAYLRAYREMRDLLNVPCKRSVLHLDGGKPDGWRLVALDDPDDWPVFLSALNCFKACEMRGML